MDEWTLNYLLECSVCLERLDTTSRVLPCQHTFCKKCLEEIVHTHKKLKCPECRIPVDIDIENLPPNVLLMRILEGIRNAPRKSVPDSNQTQGIDRIDDPISKKLNLASEHNGHRIKPSGKQHSKVDIHQPYAIALYNFNAREPGDLSFRKGDIIFLRRKIDENWYQGECNGLSGVFPVPYVKVIICMPPGHSSFTPSHQSQTPQCKALYDFNKHHEDDEVCLHFNKGDVITVIRRIDENWAEGKLDERIGIFPISFVEMNHLAKSLMFTSTTSANNWRSRDAPPTPTDESAPLISSDQVRTSESTRLYSLSQITTQSESLMSPLTSSSSSSSSSAQSTATTTSPSSSESTAPPSPTLSPLSNSAAIKRHSYTMGAVPPPYHAPPAVHRHSAEIINSEENSAVPTCPDVSVATTTTTSNNSVLSQQPVVVCSEQSNQPSVTVSKFNTTQPQSLTTFAPSTREYYNDWNPTRPLNRLKIVGDEIAALKNLLNNVNDNLVRQGSCRSNKHTQLGVSSSALFNPPPLPAKYVAMFAYKPQKTDELELKKDNVYTVLERCQDGWFKGTNGKKCGVFPGNYVIPIRSRWALDPERRELLGNPTFAQRSFDGSPASTKSIKSSRNGARTSTGGNGSGELNGLHLTPPDLPPRSLSPVVLPSTTQSGYFNIWSWDQSVKQHTSTTTTASAKNVAGTSRTNNPENDAASTWESNNRVTESAKSPKSSDRNKDRKEKSGVGIMKRLANMKKSRSPPPSYSVDNPAFGDGFGLPAPSHARSDSCPSQFSYNTTSLDNSSATSTATVNSNTTTTITTTNSSSSNTTTSHHHRAYPLATTTPAMTAPIGSVQRIKVKYHHPINQGDILQRNFRNVTNREDRPIVLHQKSSSLDCGTVLPEDSSVKSKTTNSSGNTRERYRCIVPYPPNSEYELELRIGDIIHVHKKRDDGWYKGTVQRNGRTGLFPASFVELINE